MWGAVAAVSKNTEKDEKIEELEKEIKNLNNLLRTEKEQKQKIIQAHIRELDQYKATIRKLEEENRELAKKINDIPQQFSYDSEAGWYDSRTVDDLQVGDKIYVKRDSTTPLPHDLEEKDEEPVTMPDWFRIIHRVIGEIKNVNQSAVILFRFTHGNPTGYTVFDGINLLDAFNYSESKMFYYSPNNPVWEEIYINTGDDITFLLRDMPGAIVFINRSDKIEPLQTLIDKIQDPIGYNDNKQYKKDLMMAFKLLVASITQKEQMYQEKALETRFKPIVKIETPEPTSDSPFKALWRGEQINLEDYTKLPLETLKRDWVQFYEDWHRHFDNLCNDQRLPLDINDFFQWGEWVVENASNSIWTVVNYFDNELTYVRGPYHLLRLLNKFGETVKKYFTFKNLFEYVKYELPELVLGGNTRTPGKIVKPYIIGNRSLRVDEMEKLGHDEASRQGLRSGWKIYANDKELKINDVPHLYPHWDMDLTDWNDFQFNKKLWERLWYPLSDINKQNKSLLVPYGECPLTFYHKDMDKEILKDLLKHYNQWLFDREKYFRDRANQTGYYKECLKTIFDEVFKNGNGQLVIDNKSWSNQKGLENYFKQNTKRGDFVSIVLSVAAGQWENLMVYHFFKN
jgi:hypothetical protein